MERIFARASPRMRAYCARARPHAHASTTLRYIYRSYIEKHLAHSLMVLLALANSYRDVIWNDLAHSLMATFRESDAHALYVRLKHITYISASISCKFFMHTIHYTLRYVTLDDITWHDMTWHDITYIIIIEIMQIFVCKFLMRDNKL